VKILSVTTRNFRNLADQKWALGENFQVVSGLNEAGKSSLLEAILVGLYGDATSTHSRYELARRWKSQEGIYVAVEFLLGEAAVVVERDFENRRNTLRAGGKPIHAKDKIGAYLADHLPLPTEQGFLQTACVKQDEIRCDISASDLRGQIERRSLSATGQDIAGLTRALESRVAGLKRGWLTSAPKNPGPIKQVEDGLAKLKTELADLEKQEIEANSALGEYETVAADTEKMEEQQTRDEERLRLDREYLDAERDYKKQSAEIADLKGKLDRLHALPKLIEAAQNEHSAFETSLKEHRAKLEKALLWKQKSTELKTCEASIASLTADIAGLKACGEETKRLAYPLPTGLLPEDFLRFHALEQQMSQLNAELKEDREELRGMTEEIEAAKAQARADAQQKQAAEAAIVKLKAEQGSADHANEAKKKQQLLVEEMKRTSDKIHQIKTLVSEKTRLQQVLAGYDNLRGVNADEFRAVVASVSTLEKTIQNEGVGLEIDPAKPTELVIRIDGGAEEGRLVETLQTFSARREILVQIPGLGRLRVTNESRTAQQLGDEREKLLETLSKTPATDPQDLLSRIEVRDALTTQLQASDARLQTSLESRPLDSWEEGATALGSKLHGVSSEIEALGTTRDLSSVEKDLESQQERLNQIAQAIKGSETRVEVLTKNLEATKKKREQREAELKKLEADVNSILNRASCADKAGLKVLEESFKSYQGKMAAIQDRRSKTLNGRLESDIYSRHSSEENALQSLKRELGQFSLNALDETELLAVQSKIDSLQASLREKADHVAGLKAQQQLLEAEKLDEKHRDAVTQAEIADKKRKENAGFVFTTPTERLEFRQKVEKVRDQHKKLQNHRAELKVKSEVAGRSQNRITDLKEALVEQERQLGRLRRGLEIDELVLEHLRRAREKAFADLLAAIPVGVGDLLRQITAGKYERIEGTGFTLLPWSPEKGERLELDEMSRGTLDQFYLSVRLEALRAMFAGDLPPLILDDALVSSDPQRRAEILRVLEEFSISGQVIFLTCQNWPEVGKYACLQLG